MSWDEWHDVNPYHVLAGAAIGAGALLIGLETQRRLLSDRPETSTSQHRGSNARHVQQAIYMSPGPRYSESSSAAHAGRWALSDVSNGHIANGHHEVSTPTRNQRVSPLTTHAGRTPHPVSTNRHSPDGEQVLQSNLSELELSPNVNSRDMEDSVLQVLFEVAKSQSQGRAVVHRGISCNMCEANPLTGVRFKCLNCVDFDVCAKCEPSCGHDATHVLAKILIPIPPLCNPRKALLPVFYPGKQESSNSLTWEDKMFLSEISHYEPTDIEVLHRQFCSLCTHKNGITRDTFNHCLGPLSLKKNLVVEQLFKFYDEDGDGFIGFSDFVHGMSVLSKGSQEEKMKYAFKGYDIDSDGFVSKEDLLHMFRAYHVLSMELVRDVIKSCEEEMMASFDDSSSRPISSVFNAPIPESATATGLWGRRVTKSGSFSDESNIVDSFMMTNSQRFSSDVNSNRKRYPAIEAMTQDAILELADNIMSAADLDKDGKLSEEEFKKYTVVDTHLMSWFDSVGTVF